jgi:hypothetical protein
VKIDINKKALSVVIGGLGVVAALTFAAPASADPVIPVPPPAPVDPATVAAPAPQDTTVQAAAADPAVPPEGVPHLPSPENLPPGTTDTPVDAGQPRSLGYLRDLWHAVQTQDVSGKDALLLLTQRPLDPNAAPPPGLPANPTPPLPPEPALAP